MIVLHTRGTEVVLKAAGAAIATENLLEEAGIATQFLAGAAGTRIRRG